MIRTCGFLVVLSALPSAVAGWSAGAAPGRTRLRWRRSLRAHASLEARRVPVAGDGVDSSRPPALRTSRSSTSRRAATQRCAPSRRGLSSALQRPPSPSSAAARWTSRGWRTTTGSSTGESGSTSRSRRRSVPRPRGRVGRDAAEATPRTTPGSAASGSHHRCGPGARRSPIKARRASYMWSCTSTGASCSTPARRPPAHARPHGSSSPRALMWWRKLR